MPTLKEQAENLYDEFDKGLRALTTARMQELVEEFQRRFPKRRLTMQFHREDCTIYIDKRRVCFGYKWVGTGYVNATYVWRYREVHPRPVRPKQAKLTRLLDLNFLRLAVKEVTTVTERFEAGEPQNFAIEPRLNR